jgi:transcriptional regulator with XRE-family HTH domain
MSEPLQVNGSILQQSRDALGWSQGELASRACLSVKQVKQLEEGGTSSFYSEGVKLTAARKIAQILGVSDDELWGREPEPQAEIDNDSVSEIAVFPDQSQAQHPVAHDQIAADPLAPMDENHSNGAAIRSPILVPGVQSLHMRSEVLHVLAQPPEESELELDSQEEHHDHSSDEDPSTSSLTAQLDQSDGHAQESVQQTQSLNSSHTDSTQTSSTPEDKSTSVVSNLIKIVLLFAVALAVAAYFAQKNKTEQKEVAPPLQAVPEGSPSNGTSGSDSSGKADDASAAPQAGQSDKADTGAPSTSSSSVSSGVARSPSSPASSGVSPSAPSSSIPSGAQPLKSNTNAGASKVNGPAQETKSTSAASVPASPKVPSTNSSSSPSPSLNAAPSTSTPGSGG